MQGPLTLLMQSGLIATLAHRIEPLLQPPERASSASLTWFATEEFDGGGDITCIQVHAYKNIELLQAWSYLPSSLSLTTRAFYT